MEMKIITNKKKQYGCAICFDRLACGEKVLICNAPCNKIFHEACFEKSIEDAFVSDIKCCYCRRKFKIDCYDVNRHNLFNDYLRKLYYGNRSFWVKYIPPNPALIFDKPRNTSLHIKKPKQSKKSFYK